MLPSDSTGHASPRAKTAGVSQLLIASALDAGLCRRLLESPDEVFQEFDLSEEEKDLLRHPDHRLLPLLGAALAREGAAATCAPRASAAAPQPHAIVQARTLPDVSLVLTLVPCAQYVDGRLDNFAYAVWVNPLPEAADPASLPLPAGVALPGQPLAPLHAVIQVSAVQMQDAAGSPQVGLSAALRQSSNIAGPLLHADATGLAPEVLAAVDAVRGAASGERYGKLIDLVHALRGAEAR